MSIELTFSDEKRYLLVRSKGEFDMDEVRRCLLKVKETAESTGHRRILVDANEVSPPKAEFERFLFGKAVAEIFPVPFRTAVLFKEEFIDRLSQLTAVGKGAHYFVSGNKEEILQWLCDDGAVE